MAKNATQQEETEEVPLAEEGLLEVPPDVAAATTSPIAKRSLGVKEPIVFKWKIVGQAHGIILTLFKSVEREDADAQLQRLQGEGYYKDLQIVEAGAKIVQPATAKAALKKTAPKTTPPKPTAAPPKPTAATKAPASTRGEPKRSPAPPAKKPTAAKGAVKSAAKVVKKKSGGAASKKGSKGR